MSRPPSIPQQVVTEVFRLHEQGLGRRRIARVLEQLGCWTTKSSVDRLLRSKPPYQRTP